MTFDEKIASLFPSIRETPWNRFKELGLPTSQKELFRYVRLHDLYESDFVRVKDGARKPLQPSPNTLVFLNGQYLEECSQISEKLIALPLSRAYLTYGNFLNPRFKGQMQEEKDPFAALNGALFEEGLFLYVPPKVVCEAPQNYPLCDKRLFHHLAKITPFSRQRILSRTISRPANHSEKNLDQWSDRFGNGGKGHSQALSGNG